MRFIIAMVASVALVACGGEKASEDVAGPKKTDSAQAAEATAGERRKKKRR